MNQIVERNLERMTGRNEGDMLPLIKGESMGGNASKWKGLACVGANFFYDPKTGEIKYFENSQHTPLNIVSTYPEGVLRIALSLNGSKYKTVVDCFISNLVDCHSKTNIEPVAIKNLEETVNIYNRLYGFEESYLRIKS